jgi:hypothetical protein
VEKKRVTTDTDPSAHQSGAARDFEPSGAEVEEWAARERERRQAWLRGPSDAQKAAWAERERERRRVEVGGGGPGPGADPARTAQHYLREAQLAAEGAMSLLFNLSIRNMFDQLVRAGRDWEDRYADRPPQPKRVAIDADVPLAGARLDRPSTRSS